MCMYVCSHVCDAVCDVLLYDMWPWCSIRVHVFCVTAATENKNWTCQTIPCQATGETRAMQEIS